MPGLAAIFLFPSVRRRLRPTPARAAIGLIGAGILYGGTLLVMRALAAAWPDWASYVRPLYAWQGGHGRAFLLATLPIIVIGEELIWRGVAARSFTERLGRVGGLLGASLAYALAHAASQNPVLLGAAFLCGLYWGWLYAATDDLTAPFVCHLAWDATILFVAPMG